MNLIAKVVLAASVILAAPACIVTPGVGSSSSSGPSDSSGASIDSAAPKCAPTDVKLTGNIGGQSLNETRVFGGGGFAQGNKSELSTTFTSGQIDLSWSGIYSNDVAGNATGTLLIDGATWCAGHGSQVEIKNGSVLFHLTSLAKGDCASSPVPTQGEVWGCYSGPTH
jgi:hypothetical protein